MPAGRERHLSSDQRLGPWLTVPDRAGVFVDFDGTLSPIVDDFDRAQPLPGVAGVLRDLAERMAVVAVISGRPLTYLKSRLEAPGRAQLIGLYGLDKDSATTLPATEAAEWRDLIEAAATRAEAEAPEGLIVERKGLALTLHYRTSPTNADWAHRFAAAEAQSSGLLALPGKMSVELRPPVQTDKGTVVAELGQGLDAVMFIGDDTGDLPAFAKLSRMKSSGVTTLSVAVVGNETPAELVEAADMTVDGPAGVVALLRSLLA